MSNKTDRSWTALKPIRILHNRAVKDYYKQFATQDRKANKKSFIANILKIENEDSILKAVVKMLAFVFYIKPNNDAVCSMPVSWVVKRTSPIPQMSVIYKRIVMVNGRKKERHHDINIPHYSGNPKAFKAINYTKGSYYGGLVLKDSSKLIIYAKNETEARKVINHYKNYIDPRFIKDDPVFQPRKGQPISEDKMIAIRADYYPEGIEAPVPSTRVYFP